MPDLPPTPMDRLLLEAKPPLTVAEFAERSGRGARTIKLWIERGIIAGVTTEPVWPYRRLIPYDQLMAVSKRPMWERTRKRARTFTTANGKTMRLRATPVKEA